MSVLTKKPKRANATTTNQKISEDQIEKLISKGGEVPVESQAPPATRAKKQTQKKVSVQLRLPQSLINRIDDILDNRIVDISRHTWFLEAIESKIMAENAEA